MKGYKDTTKMHFTKGGPPGVKGAARVSHALATFRPTPEKSTGKPCTCKHGR